MLILHGGWLCAQPGIESGFLLWGEQQQTVTQAAVGDVHPYAADGRILKQVAQQTFRGFEFLRKVVIGLPTRNGLPCGSWQSGQEPEAGIALWQVTALYIPTSACGALFTVMDQQETTFPWEWGDDLRYWHNCYDYVLTLIHEHKILPGITVRQDDGVEWYTPVWEPLLMRSLDQQRMNALLAVMPRVCLYLHAHRPDLLRRKHDSQALLHDFLQHMTDQAVRDKLVGFPQLPHELLRRTTLQQRYLRLLLALQPKALNCRPQEFVMIRNALQSWHQGLLLPVNYRLCLRLEEPETDDRPQPITEFALFNDEAQPQQPLWKVRFFIQSGDDPSLLIPADQVWAAADETFAYLGRELPNLQTKLVEEIGRAAAIFTPLGAALGDACPLGCHLTVEQAYDFLRNATGSLQQQGIGVIIPNWWQREPTESLRVRYEVQDIPQTRSFVGLDALVKYDMTVSVGGQQIDVEELRQLAALKTPLVNVRGQWVELVPDQVETAMRMLNKTHQRRKLRLRDVLRLTLAGPEQGMVEEGEPEVVVAGAARELIQQFNGTADFATVDIPPSFIGELRPYQQRGLSWLSWLGSHGLGGCLADDMGLGKTVETIAYLLDVCLRTDRSLPALVICPLSVVDNWKRELNRFAPELSCLIHHGSDRLSGTDFMKTVTADVVLTTYGIVTRDLDMMVQVEWGVVIADEAQNIKNPHARQTLALRKLRARQKLALTGTPVENRLSELWSIMDAVNPGYLGTLDKFRTLYAMPIEKHNDECKQQALRRIIQPFVLRRVKTDRSIINDLPDKQESKVLCSLSTEQATLYEATLNDMIPQIEQADFFTRKALLAATLVKLKQICNHPANFLHDRLWSVKRSGKLLRLLELLAEIYAEGRHCLIFTQYAEMGSILQSVLHKRFDQDVCFLHGGTDKAGRDRMVSSFQHDDNAPFAFILSLKAGGTGLNLTRADTVFHFDRWWNPAVENQATDRAYRIGQQHSVMVYKFVCRGTIEEQIDLMIDNKLALAEAVVGSGEGWLNQLSGSELRRILALRHELEE